MFGEYTEDIENPTENKYSKGRVAAYDAIKCHVVGRLQISKFSKHQSKINDFQSKIYLPNLSLVSSVSERRKQERSKMFARSRSIVQWSAAAEKIFETTVSIRSFNFKGVDHSDFFWL